MFGSFLIVISIGIAFWRVMTQEKGRTAVISICSLAVFAGVVLIIKDRITELTVPGIGTIRAATAQVITDAKTIADLRDRVENQSATVDLVAKQASSAKALSEAVEEQNSRARQKLDTLDKAIEDAAATLAHVKSEADFIQTVEAAQNDDRNAFDKLEKLAEDKNNQYSSSAVRALYIILKSHSGNIYDSGFTIPWKDGLDPSRLSLLDLTKVYKSAPIFIKPGLLEYIWKRTDTPKMSRLDFMVDVLKNDGSLTAVEYAGIYFKQGTGLNVNPLQVEYIADWWGHHRQEFASR